MKALVTGAAGFVGSHLCDRLLSEKITVVGIDNFILGPKSNVEHLTSNSSFNFIELDLTNKGKAVKLFEDNEFDVVIHLAANSDIQKGISNTGLDFQSNLVTTYNVLEGMRLTSVREIIFSSTSAIYGRATGSISENYGPLFPTSLYGASKLSSEAFISAYCELYNIKSWIFRFPNVIGPRATHGVVFDFIEKLKRDPTRLEILGDGKQSKPYVYVFDLIDAVMKAWKDSKEQINFFNIGGEGTTSVKDIAAFIIEIMNLDNVKIEYTGGSQGWPGDVPKFVYDSSKLSSLGWNPRLSSDEAIRKSVKEILSK